MNTDVLLAAEDRQSAAAGLVAARRFIDEAKSRFSRFRQESELSRLNRAAGSWVHVSPDLMQMLELSQRYYRSTQGLFDPSILNDLVRAGYDRSMDEIKTARAVGCGSSSKLASPPVSTQTRGSRQRPSMGEMEVDQGGQRVRIPSGMGIDLGGIAKGWIVQQAARLLSNYSSPCAVSAGGDIFFVGVPEASSSWPVELEDPTDPSRTLAVLSASPGAVVTSSVTKRRWKQKGEDKHHIIDPRTGQPAETAWLSATVAAAEAPAAEAYAKALLIGGRRQAERLSKDHHELAFILVDNGGLLQASANSKEIIHGNLSINYFD